MARAEGYKVEIVIVADDVALSESKRGLAGTVLVHKIAGAAAAQGESLENVKKVAEQVINKIGTYGVGLGPCIIPAAGKPNFQLEEDEIELGLGIHGEPGVKKIKLPKVSELVNQMISSLVSSLSIQRSSDIALLVNGLVSFLKLLFTFCIIT